MSEGEKVSAKKMLNKLLAKHYHNAYQTKQRGELICWSTSIAPQEFMEAMGIQVVYPENHAAAIAAKKGAIPFLEQAEGEGYSIDNCSYARINLAYMKSRTFEVPLPLPDFLVCTNNICNTLIKWYENISKELNIPMIMIDMPYNFESEVTQASVDYIEALFKEVIRMLEEITGRPFDYERFEEVMKISVEASKAWGRAMDLAQYVPSPINGFEVFNYMALIVCMRGKQETIDVFNKLAEELEENIKNGVACYPDGEKYRVMWEGIACWPYLAHNFTILAKAGINIVASGYPSAWKLIYEPGNLGSMARVYTSIGNNCNMEYQVRLRQNLIEDFKCDGIIYHVNRSCKIMGFSQYEMQRQIHERTGVPYVTFDGDQSDPRNFAEAQFETRIQALTEMMEARKQLEGRASHV